MAVETASLLLLVASLLLVAMPGAPSSVLAPSSDGCETLHQSRVLGCTTGNLLLEAMHLLLVASCYY